MQIGDSVQVRVYKSDGTYYRWWHATVETVEVDRAVTITPVGHRVEGTQGGNTKARLNFLSATEFLVEADTDGDGLYDDYSSGTLLWSDI